MPTLFGYKLDDTIKQTASMLERKEWTKGKSIDRTLIQRLINSLVHIAHNWASKPKTCGNCWTRRNFMNRNAALNRRATEAVPRWSCRRWCTLVCLSWPTSAKQLIESLAELHSSPFTGLHVSPPSYRLLSSIVLQPWIRTCGGSDRFLILPVWI